MANKIGWGQGAANNEIGWGQGANNDIGWGSIYEVSDSGETDIIGSTPTEQLLLDQYPNAAAAYSLRALSTATVDSAVVRVRRSSDNTEQDFTATEITDGTLETFCILQDGFVTTWVDQSGNTQDAVQATASIQPKIVDNGIVNIVNNLPVIKNPIRNDYRYLSIDLNPLQPLPVTAVFAGKIDELASNVYNNFSGYLGGNVNAGTGGRYELSANSTSFKVRRKGDPSISITTAEPSNTNPFIQQGIFRESQLEGRQNGVDAVPANYSGTPFEQGSEIRIITAGGFNNGSLAPAISVFEYIFYFSDQHLNRVGIESNINSHYNIY